VTIDGFPLDLRWREQWSRHDRSCVHIHVDLGSVPADRERAAYRAMLEVNLLISEFGGGATGVDSASGRAVFSVIMPVDPETTGHDLLVTLERTIEQAHYLRQQIHGEPLEIEPAKLSFDALRA
jgi:hypothetical protein